MTRLYFTIFLIFISHFANAQNELRDLSSNLAKATHDTQRVLIYRDYLSYYLYKDNDSAVYYANKARSLAQEIKYDRGVALIYASEAFIAEKNGLIDDARTLNKKALEIFYHLDRYEGIASTYNSLGVLEGKQGNYKLAANYFFRALNIYDKHKDNQGLLRTYMKLGTLNIYLNNFDRAINYFNKVIELNKGKDKEVDLGVYNNLGTIYGMKTDFGEAIKYLELAKKINDEIGGTRVTSQLLMNIGIAYYQLREPQKAKKYYEESLKIARKFNIKEDEAKTLFNFGILFEDSNIPLALKYMDSALVIAKDLKHTSLEIDIYEAYYLLKKEIGDYKSALDAITKYHYLVDSLTRDDNKRDVELMQSNYELDKSKAEIKELELLNQQKELQNTIYILLIIAIIVILVIVALSASNRSKLNKQLVASLNSRDKLLSIIAHDLKTPINSTVSLLEVFEYGVLTEDEKNKLLKDLKNHTLITLETLENILKWGQTQIRGVKVNKKELDLNSIIKKNIDFASVRSNQKEIKIEFNSTVNDFAYIDEDHINFIIRNLLSNAIKFSNTKSTINIQYEINNGTHVLKIKDQGIGMDSYTLSRLFSNDNSPKYGTSNEKGSGLGLILSKEFIEANNGKLLVESELDKGTEFTIII